MEVESSYSNSKIYKLCSQKSDILYIGSTVDTLSNRLKAHKTDYKRFLKGTQHYISSYEVLKFDDCDIQLLEIFPCVSRQELLVREGFWQKQYANDISNTYVAGRNRHEHYQDNKTNILKDKREYYLKNKETIREKSQKHYTENKDKILKKVVCECGLEVAQKSKVRHFKSKRHLLFLQTKK